MPDQLRRSPSGRQAAASLVVLGMVAVAAIPAGAASQRGGGPRLQGISAHALPDFDRRGRRLPTAGQKAAADGATVRWNRFGTPRTLERHDGYLATGLSDDAVEAARRWIAENRELLRLSADSELELLASSPIGSGRAVLFRQRFGGLPSGHDGLVAVGVVDGKVAYVSSSLAGEESLAGAAVVSAAEAFQHAAAAVGRPVDVSDIRDIRSQGPWTLLGVDGFPSQQHARLVAVPTADEGAVPAWETVVVDDSVPLAYKEYVDARNGDVLVRENLVDDLVDNPRWKVFPASPSLDYSSTDTRELWCWTTVAGCGRTVANPSSPLPWDIDPTTALSTNTTSGNNVRSTEDWLDPAVNDEGTDYATPSAAREYVYPWTNQWQDERCNPSTTFTSPQRNDIDAALANLNAMHNRMHDWSYKLGFTEDTWNMQVSNFNHGGLGADPQHGNAQDGARAADPSRDNANQVPTPDGIPPITNMYLWQPIAAFFYAPCVDGDFDMTVIGHEYTHAISNRMVAGPDDQLTGFQARAMGESWSDLVAIEYLNEYGLMPPGLSPYVEGAYVTGNHETGIRNYDFSRSPLNYSDVGYDVTGPEDHSDGEIWSAVNFDLRSAMNAAYGSGTPALQADCADDLVSVSSCQGNRRWIQLVFDAWLLMADGSPSMLDARDALLAADVIRFGGADLPLLWNAFAGRGFGENASSGGTSDVDPVPSFESPYAQEATVTFRPAGDASGRVAELFVGRYAARAVPIADTDPATPLSDTFRIVPGTYDFLARGAGFGMERLPAELKPGQLRDLPVSMPLNLASSTNGATATGAGTNPALLVDDDEATQWTAPINPAFWQVTVRLDPGLPAQQISRVGVSAMLSDAFSPAARFTALRQFEIWTCEAKGAVDCSQDSQFTRIFTSPPDAFPAGRPWPTAPDLSMRTFTVPKTKATHVRLSALTSQCSGAPAYAGEQDADPSNDTDCRTAFHALPQAAELEVFSK